MPGMPRQNTQLFKLTSGEPDTLRGVRPVRREAFGNLPQQYGKALGAYPTADQSCPHPLRHYRQPGGRAYGAQLFQVPFRRRVPGDAYHGLHGDLRRSGAGYRDGRRHDGGHLDLRGVHGAVVFRSLQDREPLEIHMGRSLKYRCKICC